MSKIKCLILSILVSMSMFAAVDTASAYCHGGYWRHGYWHHASCNGVQCRWVPGYRDRYGYWHYPHKVCNLL